MRFKVMQEGIKLAILINQVVYIGLFLIGKALKWFKPYLTKIQKHGSATTNPEVKYIFFS